MGISLGFSRELSTLSYLMCGDRVTLGRTGELYAKILLEAHGYLADIDHERKRGDLKVWSPAGTILRVEVKAARLSKDGSYQFCMNRKTKTGRVKTSCGDCDAVILLGITKAGRVEIYVLPAKAAQNYKIIKIRPKLKGKNRWAQYRQQCGNVNLNEVEGLNREIDSLRSDLHGIFPNGLHGISVSQAGK